MSDDDPLLRLLRRPQDINMSHEALFMPRRHPGTIIDHGEFMPIHMFGRQLPSLCIGGECSIPFDILMVNFKKEPTYHEESFCELMKQKQIYISVASSIQVNLLRENSEECRALSPINFRMMRRSDVERLIGSIRAKSDKCKLEHDVWNHEERFRIAHYNFSDAHDDLFENDDLEEDFCEIGTSGWLYPSRKGMRCIICCECHKQFTPPDFVLHHHVVEKVDGLFHCGLFAYNWASMLEPAGAETSREHRIAWEKFTEVEGSQTLKRRHEIAPAVQKELIDTEILNVIPMTKKKSKIIDVVGDTEYDDDGDGDDEIDRDLDIDTSKAKAKEQLVEDLPCSSSKPTGFDLLMNPLFANLKEKFPAFFANPSPFNMWGVPKLPPTIPLPFIPQTKQGTFDFSKIDLKTLNLPKFAPLPEIMPKFDLQKLCGGFSLVDQEKLRNATTTNTISDPGWDAVKREQKLLQSLPDETVRLLDNKTLDTSMILLASSILHSK